MGRARSESSIKAEELYHAGGKTLAEIAQIMGVPEGTVRRWKSTQNWDGNKPNARKEKPKEKPNARKRGGQPGNKNAKGHGGTGPPGNTNALKHGGYSKIYWDTLTDEEKELIETASDDPEQGLVDQINLLSVRERRIMTRIKEASEAKGGLMVDSVLRSEDKRQFENQEEKKEYDDRIRAKVESGDRMPGRPYHVTTKTDATHNIILRLEEALSRCQDQKRRALEALARLRAERGDNNDDSMADDWIAGVLAAEEADHGEE